MSDASGLSVGTKAPNFTAPLVFPGGETEEVALSELLEDGPVLLVFYTSDFSPDCIEEWCSFRDFDWFTSNDAVQVVGVSKSRPYLHERFIDYLGLEFPLYADTDLDIAEKYRVNYRTFKLFARARRSCFLIDSGGTIRYRWLAEHWLDPTRDVPPVADIQDAIAERLASEDEEPPTAETADG